MLRDLLDGLILLGDNGLRAISGNQKTNHDTSHYPEHTKLSNEARQASAALMRVNHCGEVCAQALYEGQALTASSPATKQQLLQAAQEEREHLAICRSRLSELDSPTSILEPAFFIASVGIGGLTGLLGDKVSLGFVEATEDEVCKHLDRHIEALGDSDPRSTAMLESIRNDEAQHQSTAMTQGGTVFAKPIKSLMAVAAKVMTRTTAVI